MLFEIKDLKVDFNTFRGKLEAVRGVSFSIPAGSITGIVGESGSGKSVTALSLINLLPKNSQAHGDILFQGESIFGFDQEKLRSFRGKQVGVIFQEPGRSFDPIYSIGKSMAEAILAHQPELKPEEAAEKALKLLKEVNLPSAEERLKNFPHQFSGGLLQRIMIAVSLASDPELLIADEPTTALDVTIQAQIVELLLSLKKKRNLAILFISHNLALIGSVAERIIVMYGGLIMEEGPAQEVLNRPLHPYTKGLLDSLPRFGSHYSEQPLRSIPGDVPNPLKPEPGCPFAPRCWLVKEECRKEIPPFITESHIHRCIIPGVKK